MINASARPIDGLVTDTGKSDYGNSPTFSAPARRGTAAGAAQRGRMGDPTKLSAVALAGALRSGELSAVSVMRAFLERIARLNPAVNAIVSMRRADELLAEAAAADAVPRSERPPLHGIPFAVKDLTPVAGIPYTQGSPVYASRVPSEDGVMASRLRAAGAIIIGMTNVPEFGLGSHTFNPLFGTTRNPYALERSAGGSSGGAAAALAARMVRIPAHLVVAAPHR